MTYEYFNSESFDISPPYLPLCAKEASGVNLGKLASIFS